MLAATVEAATDLDVQILDGLIHLKTLLGQSIAQFRRQFRGRRKSPACTCPSPGKRRHRRWWPAPGAPSPADSSALCRSDKSLWLTQRRTIFCSTVDRIVSLVKRASDLRQSSKLVGSDVTQRKCNSNDDVSLFASVGACWISPSAGRILNPAKAPCRQAEEAFSWKLFGVLHVCGPSWVRGQILAFLQN